MDTGDHRYLARKDHFRVIWDTYFASVSGYVLRRVSSADDAADCIAETFSVVWNRLDDVPEGGDAVYWLYAVARRVIGNYRRGERRRADLATKLAQDMKLSLSFHHPVDHAEAMEAAAALATLGPEEQEILLLVSWESLDTSGLAQVLGCTPGAASVRLHRARSRLATARDEAVREGSSVPKEIAGRVIPDPGGTTP